MTDWVQKQMDRIRQERAEEDQKGGPGSGHFGHAGRPGKRGGSQPGKGGSGGVSGGGAAAEPKHPTGGRPWHESPAVPGTGVMRDDTLAAIVGDLRKASTYGWLKDEDVVAQEDMERILRQAVGNRVDKMVQKYGPPKNVQVGPMAGLNRDRPPSGEHLKISALLRHTTLAKIIDDLEYAEKNNWLANDKEFAALADARSALEGFTSPWIRDQIMNQARRRKRP